MKNAVCMLCCVRRARGLWHTHVLDFLVDCLVKLVPLRQCGAGAGLDPLPKLLQDNLQSPGGLVHGHVVWTMVSVRLGINVCMKCAAACAVHLHH